MAITQVFMDLEKEFHAYVGTKIVLNDLEETSITHQKTLEEALYVKREGDMIKVEPICHCGKLEGELYKGLICNNCNTVVESVLDKSSTPVWFRALHDDVPFILPGFWLLFERVAGLSKSDFKIIRYLTNSRYKPTSNKKIEDADYIQAILEVMGGKRSYIAFINNLEEIIECLISHFSNTQRKRDNLLRLLVLYKEHKDVIFTRYLPLMPKNMFVLEATKHRKSIDFKASYAKNATVDWVIMANKLRKAEKKVPMESISNITSKTLAELCTLYMEYLEKNMLQKSGLFRRHVYGTRNPNTARAVITPTTGKHQYDEIHIPWIVAVVLFQLDIMNKLVNKYKMSYTKARKLWLSSPKSYSPIISDVLDELLREANGDGEMNFLMQRNPSLLKGSILLMKVGSIKKDPTNLTISMSPLVCKYMNADYDGDQVNLMRVLDKEMRRMLEPLRPYYSIPSVQSPLTISGDLSLLPPSNLTLMNWLSNPKINGKDTLLKELNKLRR